MPFTLSHAAAVLPGVRRDGTGRGPFLPSALVAGSFAPDLTYFLASVLPGGMSFGHFTHSAWGVVTADVLCTALLVLLWVRSREPLVALLPRRWQGPVHGFVRGARWGAVSPSLVAKFVLSAVVGSLTHVAWDLFTHPGRLGMELFPVLGKMYAGFPLYTYAQYGSSALAAVVLCWFGVTALRRQAGASPDGVPLWDRRQRILALTLLGGGAVLGAVARIVRWQAHQTVPLRPFDYIPTICFGAGAGLLVGLVLYVVWAGRWHPAAPASRDREAAADTAGARTRTRSH
ncbi:hypothetical protein GCM10010329_11030 [Streptomyces spiroverticillatus]|uniref:DUF4184 family protein n=1 Tax=Streptomyces finlayi TaxID=67296 RepID=A0A919CA07_9ACTN|nr:DUF4184 family protein [Streptomyces finlayi]GGZ92233.1 hypothetical protein GCM10010329_11030 [Streptomyces spiroverticillatus]GHC93201.1 hypothetical protein GCM10010334_30060 [Streptomyces finlayi]